MKPFTFLLILIIVLIGCSGQEDNHSLNNKELILNANANASELIVGKWRYKVLAEGVAITAVNEYFENGLFTTVGTLEDGNIAKCSFDINGSYILGNQSISYEIKDINVNCKPNKLSKVLENALRSGTGTDDIVELTEKVMVQRTRAGNKIETTYFKVEE